jgi:hypothetical protein
MGIARFDTAAPLRRMSPKPPALQFAIVDLLSITPEGRAHMPPEVRLQPVAPSIKRLVIGAHQSLTLRPPDGRAPPVSRSVGVEPVANVSSGISALLGPCRSRAAQTYETTMHRHGASPAGANRFSEDMSVAICGGGSRHRLVCNRPLVRVHARWAQNGAVM